MSDNLPPGVTVNDIPGNRQDDLDWERFFEAVSADCEREGIDAKDAFLIWSHKGLGEQKFTQGTQTSKGLKHHTIVATNKSTDPYSFATIRLHTTKNYGVIPAICAGLLQTGYDECGRCFHWYPADILDPDRQMCPACVEQSKERKS